MVVEPRRARALAILAALMACALGCSSGTTPNPLGPGDGGATGDGLANQADVDGQAVDAAGRGFPAVGPWVTYYGRARRLPSLQALASKYRIIVIDADPIIRNFTDADIATLGGADNRVLSYLNLGACEQFRDYYRDAPAPFVPCGKNLPAQRGAYNGFPEEVWMDVGNADYQALMIDYVAARIAPRVHGFFLDNLEILEHGTNTTNGPCDASCVAGGLDLIRKLRARFPNHLLVMQNATSDAVRLAKPGGVAFSSLLDGVSREEVYSPCCDRGGERELDRWNTMGLRPGGRSFFVGTLDYVGDCDNRDDAASAFSASRAKGFSPSVSNESNSQQVVCDWSGL